MGCRSSQSLAFMLLGFSTLLLVWQNTVLATHNQEPTAAELIKLQLEDLVSMEINLESAGKQSTKAFDLAYAAFVITAEDLRQYNILTIPDALRMAPGLQVEQLGGAEWGISIRGSGGRFSRFVLVLLNGRALNNTIFSGVNWDEVAISINSIERIEVIRGPNADAWGANAVNGIINIITTGEQLNNNSQLDLAVAEDDRRAVSFRISLPTYKDWQQQINGYHQTFAGLEGQTLQMAESLSEANSKISNLDYWLAKQTGNDDFQFSISRMENKISSYWQTYSPPQVDVYLNQESKSAHALQIEWTRKASKMGEIRSRTSWDKIERLSELADWTSETFQFDFDVQLNNDNFRTSYGVNLKQAQSRLIAKNGFPLTLVSEAVEVDYSGFYLKQDFNLEPIGLNLSLGARLDHNDLTGYEFQPSLRALWRYSESERVWFSASQGASVPSVGVNNVEQGFLEYLAPAQNQSNFPLFIIASQAHSLSNTHVSAIEMGYRKVWQTQNLDLTLFKFDYQNELALHSRGSVQFSDFPPNTDSYLYQWVEFESDNSYQASGAEISFLAQLNTNWRCQSSYSYLDVDNRVGVKHLLSLRTEYQWNEQFSSNLWYRYSSGHQAFNLPSVGVFDLNLHYKLTDNVAVSYSAKNIGKNHFIEGRREFFSPGEFFNESSHWLILKWML